MDRCFIINLQDKVKTLKTIMCHYNNLINITKTIETMKNTYVIIINDDLNRNMYLFIIK